MPELAETAVFARDLSEYFGDDHLVHSECTERSVQYPAVIPKSVQNLNLSGGPLRFRSMGKFLILNDVISIRLGMTGRFATHVPDHLKKHIFAVLSTATKTVYYLDCRTFSRWSLLSDSERQKMQDRAIAGWDTKWKHYPGSIPGKGHIIDVILRQGQYTGIGNYLANEVLGKLGLNPLDQWRTEYEPAVIAKIQEIAHSAFSQGGNSFAGGYIRLDGSPGMFSSQLEFYRSKDAKKIVYKGRPLYIKLPMDNLEESDVYGPQN